MPDRLIIAYILILLLSLGAAAAVWRLIYNSPRRKMRRYYRDKHRRTDS